MPSQEFDEARGLLDELESRWISLLLWLCNERGITHEDLVTKLGDAGIDALTNWQRRLARNPGAKFTVLHFLPFSGYVDVATGIGRELAALGTPPPNWIAVLRDQNRRAVTYRNDLQHAQRFDDLPPSDRRAAVAVFREQIAALETWWPNHPHTIREQPAEEEDPFRSAVRLVSRDSQSVRPLATLLGFTPVKAPINLIPPGQASPLAAALGSQFGSLYEVGHKRLASGQARLLLAVLDHWPEQSAARERYRRRLARALVNAYTGDRFLILLVDGALQADGSDRIAEVEIIYPRQRPSRPFSTVRATIDLERPTRYQIELLAELNVGPDTSLQQVARRWNQAFDVERVTTRFYQEFRALRDQLAAAVLEQNRDHPELSRWTVADLTAQNPSEQVKQFQLNLTSFATRQLSRLLFLWFLQQKGWLGSKILPAEPRTYLVDLFQSRPKPGDTYFSEVLVPLFFDGVGRPPEDARHQAAMARLGGSVPYLDGGLFRVDADAFERDLFGVEEDGARRHAIILPDALFDPRHDNPDLGRSQERQRTLLGLLRGYRFTTQESTPDDQSVDPDPELLGKVFENLYQEDDRHVTGAYYTPREVVRYMCRRALDGYLVDQTGEHGVGQETLDRLRDEAVDWETTELHLSHAQERVLTSALERVTVIDPAVGSGAFLVGMLQEVTLLRRGIRAAALDTQIERGSEDVYAWKRHAVTRSLHGVDVNPTAVEICRLRLWLSLVIEYDLTRQQDIPALPNLEFRVIAGDSLVDRVGAVAFWQSLPAAYVQTGLEMQQNLVQLDRAIGRYREADQHERINEVRQHGREIRSLQGEIASIQLGRTIADAQARHDKLLMTRRPSQRAIDAARQELRALDALRANLRTEAPVLKPLLWPLVFRDVFEWGGFDIAIANPPYVGSIPRQDIESTRHSFSNVMDGRSSNLYVLFFERAIQLLKPQGWLALITNNKYMRQAYGRLLRQRLSRAIQIKSLIDFGDVNVFEADAYPAIVVGQLANKIDGTEDVIAADLTNPVRAEVRLEGGSSTNADHVRAVLGGLEQLIWDNRTTPLVQADLQEGKWILTGGSERSIIAKMYHNGAPFSQIIGGNVRRGVTTGANDVFVIGEATRRRIIDTDPGSAQIIYPYLEGPDVRRWQIGESRRWIIFTRRGIDIDQYPGVLEYLLPFQAQLQPRKQASQGQEGRKPGNYKWYEIQDDTAYFSEFLSPKAVWRKTSLQPAFAFDDSGAFLGNTLHFIGRAELWMVAVLNSAALAFLLDLEIPKLRGGYLEVTSTRLESTPLPHLSPNDKSELSRLAQLRARGETTAEIQIDEIVNNAFALSDDEIRLLVQPPPNTGDSVGVDKDGEL